MVVSVQPLEIKIGEISINCTVNRSKKRRRTLSLQFDPQTGITAHIPWRTSAEYLHQFIHSHEKWILKRLNQLNAIPHYTFTTGEQIPYLDQVCHLIVSTKPKQRACCTYQAGQLQVVIKPQETETLQRQAVYLQLKKWFSMQAQLFLPERIAFWQEQLGVKYQGLRISNAKRQWGCCHANNIISINWRIMLTSMELVDYLLVHELCHIKHKNHSPQFWDMVGMVIPDYRVRRRTLRTHAANYFNLDS